MNKAAKTSPPGTAWEVGAIFLRLGLTSFGGPIAHLGYFRREFVQRRRWLDEEHFAQLLALCQFLPGPASSQLGFSIGLLRAGWAGALAAFVAFTLPSALLLFAFAEFSGQLAGPWGQAVVHGLKLVAVAVVAQGLLGMARSLCPDLPRALLAVLAAVLMIFSTLPAMQLLVVAGGAALGPLICRQVLARQGETFALAYGARTGSVLLFAYGALLVAALVLSPLLPPLGQMAGAFYRTGALVFGGGHVVLPLLKHAIVDPGWVSPDTFLTGYGAAQAVPGPMFTLSSFLGKQMYGGQGGAAGAAIGVLSIFLPGLLAVSGTLPFWRVLAARDRAARMLAGVNAAVVGLLAAAFYDPVWVSAVGNIGDVAIAAVGFAGLVALRWPAWAVVIWCVGASLARHALA
ncbi:chromate efflux transporter [Dyella sp. LX-66]|uniref:chromate efflux transporter n=1 Tax=unclassified Dyella TaxID=2634549 RepID=UPI001BE029F4|nr:MULTISPECIES: chromate efflux transporter [unclassified Dyella]MBT2117328.1 chromate efflux transporter [Dyella sp. LX-1]MBT2138392.1 chromate efflux transporter [Dyella sp. LX-66]